MRFLIVVLATIFSNIQAQAQAQNDIQARHSRYMERAEVRRLTDSISVTANDARPLAQTVTALSEEFAWVIDFEDPPYYSKYDLVDDTASQWRAAHPSAKRVTVIAGYTFQAQFMLPQNALAQSQVTVGGQDIPTRVLLLQTLSAVKMKLYWRLYYDHDVKMYGFSLLPLMKANYDASGNRTTDFVR